MSGGIKWAKNLQIFGNFLPKNFAKILQKLAKNLWFLINFDQFWPKSGLCQILPAYRIALQRTVFDALCKKLYAVRLSDVCVVRVLNGSRRSLGLTLCLLMSCAVVAVVGLCELGLRLSYTPRSLRNNLLKIRRFELTRPAPTFFLSIKHFTVRPIFLTLHPRQCKSGFD